MKLVVKPKNKKQEKAVKHFLKESAIAFTVAAEDAAVYKTSVKKTSSKKEKNILEDLGKSVEFVNKYRKGKAKAKPLQQLLNEL